MSRKKYRSFKILKKLGSNTYLVDLPPEVPTSSIFNIGELYEYHGEAPSTIDIDSLASLTDTETPSNVEDILDVRESATRHGTHCQYLVRWRRQPLSDSSWISKVECADFERTYSYTRAIRMFSRRSRDFSNPGRTNAAIFFLLLKAIFFCFVSSCLIQV